MSTIPLPYTDGRIRFIHRRYFTEDNQILPNGGLTLAFRYVGNGEYEFAMAKCCFRDNFNRKRGRTIAEARLLSGKNYLFTPVISAEITPTDTPEEINRQISSVFYDELYAAVWQNSPAEAQNDLMFLGV